MSEGNNPYWERAVLSREQEAKCLLLGMVIFQSRKSGRYIIAKATTLEDALTAQDLYVRPAFTGVHNSNGSHVEVDTFEECVEMWINPEKFGGRWG